MCVGEWWAAASLLCCTRTSAGGLAILRNIFAVGQVSRHTRYIDFRQGSSLVDAAKKRNAHAVLVITTVFAIYQILWGWKRYKYYYETDELPNPRPTQPKKK